MKTLGQVHSEVPAWRDTPVYDYVDTLTWYLDSSKNDNIWRKKDILSET